MTTVERLKNRLEEIREENRTPIMRQRSFDAQSNSLFFEAGFEAAIKELERALQQTPCSTPFVPTDEQIDAMWEERNSSGTYLEGNLCRREGAKKIRDMMLGMA